MPRINTSNAENISVDTPKYSGYNLFDEEIALGFMQNLEKKFIRCFFGIVDSACDVHNVTECKDVDIPYEVTYYVPIGLTNGGEDGSLTFSLIPRKRDFIFTFDGLHQNKAISRMKEGNALSQAINQHLYKFELLGLVIKIREHKSYASSSTCEIDCFNERAIESLGTPSRQALLSRSDSLFKEGGETLSVYTIKYNERAGYLITERDTSLMGFAPAIHTDDLFDPILAKMGKSCADDMQRRSNFSVGVMAITITTEIIKGSNLYKNPFLPDGDWRMVEVLAGRKNVFRLTCHTRAVLYV